MRLDPGRERTLLAAAITTLTRLPVPCGALPPDWLARSAKWFPLVGAGLGAASGLVLWAASDLWAAPIPGLLAVAASLLLTGALHEDGLADTADGLGARTREARLAIMKDPRVGSFGVLALGIVLSLKVAALATVSPIDAAVGLVSACAVSRVWAVLVMSRTVYAGDRTASKLDHGIEGPGRREVAVALLLALGPLLLLDVPQAVAGLALSAAGALLVAGPVCRALGGYTGDVLGAVIAVSETAFLLGQAAFRA